MREKQQKQMPLMEFTSNYIQEKEPEVISNIIDSTPTISEHVQRIDQQLSFRH